MRLIVSGAAGRMGRMVVRTIHESDGFKLAGATQFSHCFIGTLHPHQS